MKFGVGDHVRIDSDYPFDRMLQGVTGNVIALPTNEHPDEYLVRLDGGISQNLYLKGRLAWVSASWLVLTQ